MSAGKKAFSASNSLIKEFQVIKTYGLRNWFKQLWIISDPKVGNLVGKDEFGNEYYENKNEIVGRDRWVLPAKRSFDASQVPSGWHAWLAHVNDDPPTKTNAYTNPAWRATFRANLTMSDAAYRPYNTTKEKIDAWKPDGIRQRKG